MKKRGQAKVLIFMLVILILGFSMFVYSSDGKEIENIKYTSSTLTICDGDKCNLLLYSGIKFIYEDEIWKDRREARSFKNSGIKCVVNFDGSNIANCIDWNETARVVEFSTVRNLDSSVSIPLRKYTLKYNKVLDEFERKYVNEFEKDLSFDKVNNKQILVLKANPDEILEFGKNSTEIKLGENEQRVNTYCGDSTDYKDWGRENVGMQAKQTTANSGNERGYLKFNITGIPSNQIIESAYIYGYVNNENGDPSVEVYHVHDQNIKQAISAGKPQYYPIITWNSQPCGNTLDSISNSTSCNVTMLDSTIVIVASAWYGWDVLFGLKTDYVDENKNSSYLFMASDEGGSTKYAMFTTGANTPYLNITYTPDTDSPAITLHSPYNNTNLITPDINFIYNVSDASSIDECRLYLNTSLPLTYITSTDTSITKDINQSIALTDIPDGNYYWKFQCKDSASNYGNSTINSFTLDVPSGFPGPDYDSGWVNINNGEFKQFTHNVLGNENNYFISTEAKCPTIGINNLYVGLNKHTPNVRYGWYYYGLNNTAMIVYRGTDDIRAPQIRVRIWKYD